jgi:hypothetical protein
MLGIVAIQHICKVIRRLMTGNFGWAEILHVPPCSLYYKVPIIFHLRRIFVVLDVQCGCSQSERALLSQVHVGQEFVVEDIVACIQLQQWNYVGKTSAQNAHK